VWIGSLAFQVLVVLLFRGPGQLKLRLDEQIRAKVPDEVHPKNNDDMNKIAILRMCIASCRPRLQAP
jgi:hypothetical protein